MVGKQNLSLFAVGALLVLLEAVLGDAWQAAFVAVSGGRALLLPLDSVLGSAWPAEFVPSWDAHAALCLFGRRRG